MFLTVYSSIDMKLLDPQKLNEQLTGKVRVYAGNTALAAWSVAIGLLF
jgi:hypothetical protein